MAHYLDTSALVKLVVVEPESAALRDWLTLTDRHQTTSELARTELMRTVRRKDQALTAMAHELLTAITIVSLDRDTLERAGRLDPVSLHSLDAIHLASALNLADSLESIVTYDDRLGESARQHGIVVTEPA